MTDKKITVELSGQYAEHLELLKQIIPSSSGEQITDNTQMVEALIDSFMAFIEEQAGAHNHAEGEGCCGGEEKKEKGHSGCGCSH